MRGWPQQWRLARAAPWWRNRNVGPIDGPAVGPRNQVFVRIDGNLDAAVPELLFHIHDTLALCNSSEPKIVDADTAQASFRPHPLGHMTV